MSSVFFSAAGALRSTPRLAGTSTLRRSSAAGPPSARALPMRHARVESRGRTSNTAALVMVPTTSASASSWASGGMSRIGGWALDPRSDGRRANAWENGGRRRGAIRGAEKSATPKDSRLRLIKCFCVLSRSQECPIRTIRAGSNEVSLPRAMIHLVVCRPAGARQRLEADADAASPVNQQRLAVRHRGRPPATTGAPESAPRSDALRAGRASAAEGPEGAAKAALAAAGRG